MASVARDRGLALIVVLLATMLLAAIGVALVTVVSVETQIARGFRDGRETAYAAEAALERAAGDLSDAADWNAVLAGGLHSTFADATRTPTPPGGGPPLDLASRTEELRSGSGRSGMWRDTRPDWQLFAWGPLAGLHPGAGIESRLYVAVWVADDPSDDDGREGVDANGIVMLRAEAYGHGGARRALEAEISRPAASSEGSERGGVRIAIWHELR